MKKLIFIMLATLGLGVGCGASVKPIDLHDPNIPLDARRFIADAQDAVSISRARLDDAEENYENTVRWRSELTTREMWPAGSENVVAKLDEFTDARVKMAELLRLRAEVELDLAEAKYTQATAETAMRNDIAVYDLEPIRALSETTRNRLENVAVRIEEHRVVLDKITQEWWRVYGDFSQKNEVPAFYMSPEIMREAQARAAANQKAIEAKKAEQPAEAAEVQDGQIKLGL
ncbi:hypothetical protein FRD01_24025 [Microvenator marinus]|uniref:Lipoprotein n=1 Tax=Microvenator marinus TaxID=2600177 RepID=A0A5B8Y1I5_9DELT|nr:hypothetical protein [Microvenator marinus]QED30243.1 hypothetical protein FRD01_24025 [Microvenator marinus]